jgi:twitching motility two-component system response regulator PilH
MEETRSFLEVATRTPLVNLKSPNSLNPISKPAFNAMTTVLVVEDSRTQRAIVVEMLKKRGLTVIEAGDGLEALEILKTQPLPHLILLDIIMPRMNGYDVCRWVKSNPQTFRIPVVMCTSKGQASERYWGRKQGADAYLVKPFMLSELLSVMKQALERSQQTKQPLSSCPELTQNLCSIA